jgi:TRAP-type transport system periplasmic protein
MKSRSILPSLGAAVALLCLTSAVAQAQSGRTFTLRLNHVLAPTEPNHAGFQTWAKRVDERTNGGLKIQVFHSAQLGVEEDIIEQMRQGAAIGQNTDAARLGTYVKGIAVMNGPYFAESLEDVDRLSRSPTIQKWQEELANQHGLKVVCFDWVQGYRHFFTNNTRSGN